METSTDNVENKTSATAGALVEDVNRLKQDVGQLTSDAKAHGRAHVDAAQKRFNQAVVAAKAQLAAHPLALLGVGVLLGYVFGRRGIRRRLQD